MTDYSGFNFIETTHNDTYPAIDPAKSNLSGKYVFITGASKGIGRASALAYARAGAAGVAIAARSPLKDLETEIGKVAQAASKAVPKVLSLKLDVQDAKSIESAARETESAFGRLDLLINNAGYLEKWADIEHSDPDEWWKSWDINIRGVYLATRAFLPLLKKTSGGDKTIINLSSIGAHRIAPGGSAYQSAKFALLRFTEFINGDHGKEGVLAYAVHPGGVPTELALQMPDHMHAVLVDTPELAADTMVFLTQKRREWLAGRYISVTWDMPKFLAMEKEIKDTNRLKVRMVLTE